MQIATVEVHNFRSIRHIKLTAQSFLVLLGPNNHGKSNVLAAIDFILSPAFKVEPDDFFAFRPPEEDSMWVEVRFVDLTEQEKRTFRKYLQSDRSVTIRRTATIDDQNDVEAKHQGYVEEPHHWWLREAAFDRLNTQDLVRGAMEKVPDLAPLLEGGGRITKQRVLDFQKGYVEQHREELSFSRTLEKGPLLGTKNVGGGVLPDFYLIPAVRDLSDETKVRGTTAFGRLLQRTISEMADRDPRFKGIRSQMEELVAHLNARPEEPSEESDLGTLEAEIAEELSDWGVSVSINVTPPELEKLFELGTELRVHDGHDTIAEKKGHGLQRALIFALIKAWAKALRRVEDGEGQKARKASESLVFAFEEPELFLHPHAQRTLARSLREVASTPEHQVMVCTHSTHFLNLNDYKSVVVVSKDSAKSGTVIRQCVSELFEGDDLKAQKDRFHMAAWVNPDRAELFFARKVILVEGETEYAALPFVADKIGCLDNGVSVIDCGSKFNLPLYVTILNGFGLRYLVVHDEDPLPDPIPPGWSEDKVKAKRVTFEMNAKIASLLDPELGRTSVFSPDFEGMCGVSRSQGDRKGKAIAALEHLASLSNEELPAALVAAVREAYA